MVDNIKHYLLDWAQTYYTQRDLMNRAIQKISKEDDLVMTLTDKLHVVVVEPLLGDIEKLLSRIRTISVKGNKVSLVVINNKENLNKVIGSWNELINVSSSFNIVFVNPFSQTEKKWIIFPSTHHSIADEAVLIPGLESLFSTVEEINIKEFEKNIE